MNVKYYIPSIEEFHVGFEYEWKCNGTQTDWTKSICNTLMNPLDVDCRRINDYRVKYLDKKDIESLGFKLNFKSNKGKMGFEKDIDYNNIIGSDKKVIEELASKGKVLILEEDNTVTIRNWLYSDKVYFKGTIKNKSELKVLLKQLNIS